MSTKTIKIAQNSNYDNLRNIDSDDSIITSPERGFINNPSNNYKNRSNIEANKSTSFNVTEKNITDLMKQQINLTSMSEIIEKKEDRKVFYN
jgi:hypothetical protein